MNPLLSKLVGIPYQRIFMLSVALGAGYFYFFTYDSYSRLSTQVENAAKEIENQKRIQSDTQDTLKKEIVVKESVAQLAEKFETIAKSLPSQLTPSDVIGFVDKFAEKIKLKEVNQTPGTVTKRDIVEEVPVQVSFVGTYFQIGEFILQASTFQPMTRVSSYRITADSSASSRYNLNVRLFAYRSAVDKAEEPKK
jgi:Tfp pilus assembly protein PilO